LIDLPVTLVTACVLGIFYVGLSVAVSGERGRSKIGLGSGMEASVALGAEHQAPRLLVAVRRHGHFAEYVPLSILLIMLLEIEGASRLWLCVLAALLVVSRAMIAFGMGRSAPNVFRAGGNVVQLGMIVAASLWGLVLAFTH
jgi:uncharacterized membrane protein YecN with MAPEG domain